MRSFLLAIYTRMVSSFLVPLINAVLSRPVLAARLNSMLLRWPVFHCWLRGLAGQPPAPIGPITPEASLTFDQKLTLAAPEILAIYERLKSARNSQER